MIINMYHVLPRCITINPNQRYTVSVEFASSGSAALLLTVRAATGALLLYGTGCTTCRPLPLHAHVSPVPDHRLSPHTQWSTCSSTMLNTLNFPARTSLSAGVIDTAIDATNTHIGKWRDRPRCPTCHEI
jgi:hypothetical protein